MSQQFGLFVLRWALNSLGLWIAIRLIGNFNASYDSDQTLMTYLLAGLVLSLINVVLRPIIIILSLPAILLTLGLFTLVVNGLMVYIAGQFVEGIELSFGASIVAGIVVSLVNYVLTGIIQIREERSQRA